MTNKSITTLLLSHCLIATLACCYGVSFNICISCYLCVYVHVCVYVHCMYVYMNVYVYVYVYRVNLILFYVEFSEVFNVITEDQRMLDT